jgi:hypothetical protein
MNQQKSQIEREYELRLTKKILERVLELNKDVKLPEGEEIERMEEELRKELEHEFPNYKIQTKKK